VAVPLFWEAKISGVLAVHSSQANAFEESDRVLLETLASQVVAAMERIRLFESMEHERRRLSAVLHGVADAILVLDAQGHLQLVNPAGQQLFTDVDTKLGHALPAGHGYDDFIGLFEQARQMGAATQGEITWPDGRTLATLITPIEDGGEVAILHDVTHFKDLDRVKNEFIATASHDLKNPITSILGYAGLLDKAGPLNEAQAGFANRIHKAADQMYELVQNLLELARMDLGVELQVEACDLREMVTGVADEFQTQAAHKQQSLRVLPFEPPDAFLADPVRLRQVLRNLVGNAIKYTPEGGGITVATDVNGAHLRLKVQDTGVGIPAEDLPFIFDKFYRVRTSDTKDIEGNGLGLAIVKSIIEQHGGQITVESRAGQGSSFTIVLPLTPLPEGAATSLHQPAPVA
jgi:two-component system sensor histidine kinase ResE